MTTFVNDADGDGYEKFHGANSDITLNWAYLQIVVGRSLSSILTDNSLVQLYYYAIELKYLFNNILSPFF